MVFQVDNDGGMMGFMLFVLAYLDLWPWKQVPVLLRPVSRLFCWEKATACS